MPAGYKLKTFGKALIPPVLLAGVKAALGSFSKSGRRRGERTPDWYDRAFSWVEETHRHYSESQHYHLWAAIAQSISRDEVSSVLDVGCGSGQFALLLRDRGLQRYWGIDFSPKRVAWARKICPGYSFFIEDALGTDLFRTLDYDAVVCVEFLEHIERDIEMIREIRPGARFYGAVPNFPFASHVRHFASADDVGQRYGEYFKNFRTGRFLADKRGRAHFLMEGTKL